MRSRRYSGSLWNGIARRMSTAERSIGGCRSAIQSASTQPTPPADWMPTELKPVGDEAAVDLGSLAEVVDTVGRERLGPLKNSCSPQSASAGTRWISSFEDRTDVVPVLGQRAEGEVARDPVELPDLSAGLEEAGHDLAGLLLEVGVAAGIAQRRHVRARRLRVAR